MKPPIPPAPPLAKRPYARKAASAAGIKVPKLSKDPEPEEHLHSKVEQVADQATEYVQLIAILVAGRAAHAGPLLEPLFDSMEPGDVIEIRAEEYGRKSICLKRRL